ncbi:HDOD domain-containing protein [Thiocystis violacea]|uniref:HDOD domain-containing protein n=1 Tax=Thiocystis violacea TaxID=13725 RepID=UPI001902C479|nr:HDOD domain-containing protein [Thiocystis violacea]MBK1722839.1 histidine kinase [Thiocystis violacea]
MTLAANASPRASASDRYPSKSELESAFRAIRRARVPQIPDLVFALRDELRRPEPDLRRAAELIGQDPAMAGQVLKTVNSPFFFCPTKISSVQRAVMLMGIGKLANLVTAEAINRVLGAGDGRSRAVWDAAMAQARLMAAISGDVEGVTADEAYLFGIMQDVGSLIFADLVPDYSSEWVLCNFAAPQALIDCERRLFGVDHMAVGFLLAGTWRLPEHLAMAIYHHHEQEITGLEDYRVRALIAIAKLAYYLAGVRHETHDSSEMLDYRESASQELALSDEAWSRLAALAGH